MALVFAAPWVIVSGMAEKGLSAKQARDLIRSMPGVELNKSAVRVVNVSTAGDSAEVLASVRTAFRLRKGEGGKWQVAEVRTGDRRWEEIDVIARALKVEGDASASPTPLLADLVTLVAEFEARERERAEKKKRDKEDGRVDEERDATGKKKNAKEDDAVRSAEGEGDLRRGAFVVKSFSALLSSSTVEAEVETAFRFTREGGKKWRVSALKVGGGEWQSLDALNAALDAEKNRRARAELEIVRAALEAFRRERGFYVAAEDYTTLIDHLSPRHLPRILRIDPWQRPYRYKSTPTGGYLLASDGADGKPGTADDLTVGNNS